MNSVLNVSVSCFKNYFDNIPKNVNLLTFLQSDKLKEKVELIRTIESKKERDKIKATLPAISPAAILKTRAKEIQNKVETLSGLMQFDIDLKGNENVKDWEQVKNEISKFPFVAYISLSVSGCGLWGLIPIEQPTELKFHFDSVIIDFQKIGLKLDISKGKNPTDLRGYSFDLNAYFNHKAQTYTKQKKPQERHENKPHNMLTNSSTKKDIIEDELQKLIEAPDGEKWNTLRTVSYCLGGLVKSENLDRFEIKGMIEKILKDKDVNDREHALCTMNECFNAGENEPFELKKAKRKTIFQDWKPPQKYDTSKLIPLPPIKKKQEQKQRFYCSHNTLENFTNNATKFNTIKKGIQNNLTGWNIHELENYFNTIDLNRKPFVFIAGHEIINLKMFVNSHFEVVKAQSGNETFEPYLLRLQQVKKNIELNQN